MLTLLQWRDGRRGQDGWGRYTRRRKWYRDAELVEATPSTDVTPVPTPRLDPIADGAQAATPRRASHSKSDSASTPLTRIVSNGSTVASIDPTLTSDSEYAASLASDADEKSTKSKRGWFKKRHNRSRSRGRDGSDATAATVATSISSNLSRRSDEDDVHTPLDRTAKPEEWRLGDDMRMQLDI